MSTLIELHPLTEPIVLPALPGFKLSSICIGTSDEAIRAWIPETLFGKPGQTSEPSQTYAARISSSTESTEIVCELQALSANYSPHLILPENRALALGFEFRDGKMHALPARIYRLDSSVESEFEIGSGISRIQTDRRGNIWVSYSDEGVYGNFESGPQGQGAPFGASGLTCFDGTGNRLWDFLAPEGFGHIDDCYALNVADDATWLCYYSDFAIARVDSSFDVRAWETKLSGTSELAIREDLVLAYGGYGEHKTDCSLLRLEDHQATHLAQVRLVLPEGLDLKRCIVIGRGEMLHVFTDNAWWFTENKWWTFRVPEFLPNP